MLLNKGSVDAVKTRYPAGTRIEPEDLCNDEKRAACVER